MFYRILQWLTRARRESPYPRGFYLRGILIFCITGVPMIVWLQRLLEAPERRVDKNALSYCPPSSPTSLPEVLQHPERYQMHPIWILGILRQEKPRCIRQTCQKGKTCCSPCRARLFLQVNEKKFSLSGVTKQGSLTCQGTSCAMTCGDYEVGKMYAIYGTPRLASRYLGVGQQAHYTMKSFWVQRACKVNYKLSSTPYHLPDPRLPASSK
ncbi:MAG: hypothetical protein H6728_09250 [Myxococcales bacterium]|nr:hypothetical protein [Myxococcales bacterium]MCB9643250.1 hypothetical protein [Myxococcales bacterium]